jgi:hypothetical protein
MLNLCQQSEDSWSILGTNLSKKTDAGWDTETNRLLLMDRKDFNKLGIGIDELVGMILLNCNAYTLETDLWCTFV